MNKEMLKTIELVLRKRRIPTGALDKVYATMRKAKAEIDAMVGLNEDNMFRVEIPMVKSEQMLRKDYPVAYSVVAHLLHQAVQKGNQIDLSTISLVKNEILMKGQPGKISKILAKQLEDNDEIIEYCAPELKLSNRKQFLPRLGDVIKSGRKLVVSTNLLDFLTASDNAAFSSCHSFGHENYNGNIAYASDGISLISFIAKETAKMTDAEIYKLGRTWMAITDKGYIVQPKSYGAYFGFERDAARAFLEEKVSAKFGIENEFLTKHGITFTPGKIKYATAEDHHYTAALYFDNYGIDLSYPAKVAYEMPVLQFAPAMCLECGITTTYKQGGTCRGHYGKARGTCEVCGERHNMDTMNTVHNQLICKRCTDAKYSNCSYCGEWHEKGNVTVIKGRNVCTACDKKHFTLCSHCGLKEDTRKLKELAGVGKVCGECVPKFMHCSVCGLYHLTDNVTYHKYVGRVCNNCLGGVAFKCQDCGEMYHNKYRADGEELCTACDAKRKGKEVGAKVKPRYADLPAGWEDFTEEVG